MTIRLKPALEAADEFVNNNADITAKIEEGYSSAERGKLLDSDQVRAQIDERKQAWRNEKQR